MDASIVLSAALYFLASARAQECSMITQEELGSTGTPSRDGLLAETYVNNQFPTPPRIRILNFHIVCLASGRKRDKYRYVSVVVRQTCDGTGRQCEERDEDEEFMAQYDFQCQGDPPRWNIRILGSTENSRTPHPIASFATEERRDCSACTTQIEGSDAVTHCVPCHSTCRDRDRDETLMQCFGFDESDCCFFYEDDECVEECEDNSTPDEDSDYTCDTSSSGLDTFFVWIVVGGVVLIGIIGLITVGFGVTCCVCRG